MVDDIRTFVMGLAPVLASLLEWLGWRKMIDNCIGSRGSQLSVGTRVDALFINILTDRKALYKVMEFYETMDTELLFGEEVTPADLNDDALGRALDILHDADIETLYGNLAMSAIQSLKVWEKEDA